MQKFDFDIEYVEGKENVVVVALSRRLLANAISGIRNLLLDEIKGHYTTDDFFKLSFEILSKDAKTVEEIGKFKSFEVEDEILYYNGRVCTPKFR